MRSQSTNAVSPRVAFFLPDLFMGGGQRVFLALAASLVQRGYLVELIVARKHGELLADIAPGVALVDLDAYRPNESLWWFGVRTVFYLAMHLRKKPPDVLFSTLSGSNLAAIFARLLSRRRFRLCIREAATLANVKSKLRLRLMRLSYRLADRIIVLTNHMQQQLITELKLPVDKIVVIGNPVDTENIVRLAHDSSLVRQAQGFKPYVVCVGRLSEQKDFATAIRAMGQLNFTDILNLVLVGDGPLKSELRRLAQTLGIEDRVHFVGLQTNPYPWIAEARVFVLSSRWEGFPNVLLEAQSLGVPIVATAYDESLYSLLCETEHTRIVDVGDAEAMASAISWAAEKLRVKTFGQQSDQLRTVLAAYEGLIPSNPTKQQGAV